MSQKNSFHIIMKEPAEKPSCIFIGQMSSVSQNSLFQIVGIFSYLKHPDIMVGLQKKRIQILKIFNNIVIIFPKVRSNTYRAFPTFQAIAYRLSRIMRNGKRIDFLNP